MPDEPSSLEKYRFLRELEAIEKAEGRGTELISVYVPPDRQISDVANYLRQEYSQASNIKSKTTRKNVLAALESILQRLKSYRRAPPHGVVFFVGHKQVGADKTEMVQFVVEPPEPVPAFLYRCDSAFHTAPLKEMLREKDTYGLLVLDQGEATLGLLRGKRIEVIKNVQSLVPRKHRMGGQSARRFERLHEEAVHEFFKKVGDLMTEAFLGIEDLRGILVGGPGYTKESFVHADYVHHELKKVILPALLDTGYTDESGLRELVEKARDVLADLDLMREKQLVQDLMNEIKKEDGGLAVYGEAEVRRALELGAVETLLVSEGLRKERLKLRCPECGFAATRTAEDNERETACPECGAETTVETREDIIEELTRVAADYGTKVELISKDSEEGTLLVKAFGGLAGILRYRVA
jgi:peptide chain release factor subunit 1